MAVLIERKADFHILQFQQELNIFSVRDDFDSLQVLRHEALAQLIIDLSAVQDFDTAGLQLLLWLRENLQPLSLCWLGLDNPPVQQVTALYRLQLADQSAEA